MNIFVSHLTTRKIALLGLLIALNLVVAKFLSFGIWSVRISFTFAVTFLMAAWFGPILAGVAAGLADIVSALLLNGGQGSYFFGFTISAFLGAFIYGLFFYQKEITNWRLLAAILLNLFLVDAVLNTWWVCLLYHTSFNAIFWMRAFKELLM
ncbi:folate family ECF transporter S component, partial [Liquorilactobacillus ghanensis]